jgi:hypothetical protein
MRCWLRKVGYIKVHCNWGGHLRGVDALQGATITHVSTARSSELRKVVAVNDDYITYGLPKGQIRILHRHENARALLKKHSTQLVELRSFWAVSFLPVPLCRLSTHGFQWLSPHDIQCSL